jgi:hypothetical protein
MYVVLITYTLITLAGFSRGIWANFRHDACYVHRMNHYVAMMLYMLFWPVYLLYECACNKNLSVRYILASALQYEGYITATRCKVKDEAMRRIHRLMSRY